MRVAAVTKSSLLRTFTSPTGFDVWRLERERFKVGRERDVQAPAGQPLRAGAYAAQGAE
jgi:hypothetical protein